MNKRKRKQAKERRERHKQESERSDSPSLDVEVSPVKSKPTKQVQSDSPKLFSLRPHPITIFLTVFGLLISGAALYWAIGQPDIRYIPVLDPQSMTTVESTVDSAGNFIDNIKVRTTYTNFSFKPGYIDKVEFVPQSIETLPNIKVTGIDKTFIYWHQKKVIEVNFLMTTPSDPLNHANTICELKIDQVLAVYDNSGKRVQLLPDGRYGRIDLKFNRNVTVKVTYQ
jgi:hypothetical protein